jgi:thiol-disulfide isomerase/thioredoxin
VARPRRPAAGLLTTPVLIALLAGCAGGSTDAETTEVERVSEPLPLLEGEAVDGDATLSTADHAGEVLVLNVWASWCAPCEAEMPELVRVAERYADRGVTFLGINHTDQLASARTFARRYEVPYDSFHDDAGRFAAKLGYLGLPDTYVVDAGGTIRFAINGATTEAELAGLLDEVLADDAVGS